MFGRPGPDWIIQHLHTVTMATTAQLCHDKIGGQYEVENFDPQNCSGFIECQEQKARGTYADVFCHEVQLTGHEFNEFKLGEFFGVVESFNHATNYGLIISAGLRAKGHNSDVFVHSTQIRHFYVGSAVQFTAYLDGSKCLIAKGLRQMDIGPILKVGILTLTQQAFEAPTLGYLTIGAGAVLQVLYVGDPMDETEGGWLYGKDSLTGNQGWLPCAIIVAQHVSGCGADHKSRDTNLATISSNAVGPGGSVDYQVAGNSAKETGNTHGKNLVYMKKMQSLSIPHAPPPTRPCPRASVEIEKRAANQQKPATNHLGSARCESFSSLAHATKAAQNLGMQLLGFHGHVGFTWHYPLCDEERRSFVGHIPKAIGEDQSRKFLHTVMDGMDLLGWDRPVSGLGRMARGTKWMVKAGCQCPYRYGGVTVSPNTFPPWMYELLKACMPACGLSDPTSWPNSCNLNCYADGSDSIDWHSDDEPLFGGSKSDCRIISLSLGATRMFELRRADMDTSATCQLKLQSGDLCTMEGLTQRYYEHRVPKNKEARLRVNLTWRWIVMHERRWCSV